MAYIREVSTRLYITKKTKDKTRKLLTESSAIRISKNHSIVTTSEAIQSAKIFFATLKVRSVNEFFQSLC